jgi:hypothetical protein
MLDLDKLHLLKFWTHVEGYKSNDKNELKSDAETICSIYIVNNTIDLPEKIQQRILKSTEPDPALFDKAQEYVWNELKDR